MTFQSKNLQISVFSFDQPKKIQKKTYYLMRISIQIIQQLNDNQINKQQVCFTTCFRNIIYFSNN